MQVVGRSLWVYIGTPPAPLGLWGPYLPVVHRWGLEPQATWDMWSCILSSPSFLYTCSLPALVPLKAIKMVMVPSTDAVQWPGLDILRLW